MYIYIYIYIYIYEVNPKYIHVNSHTINRCSIKFYFILN